MSGFSAIDVIKEVKIRPGIYDRNSLDPPRLERKQQLWLQVAESVTPPDEWENFSQDEKETRISEVTNKWKNLRDHFYREVKLIESGDSNKKRKYIYYDEMEFVRPYIGYKSAPKKKRQKVIETSSDDFKINDSDIDMESFLKLSDDESNVFLKKELPNQTQSSNQSAKKYKIRSKQNVSSNKTSSSGHQAIIKNFDMLRKKDDAKNPTFKIREGDISFCLSLVQHLRELTGARKLSAKIDILKVLHKNIDEVEHKEELLKTRHFEEMKEDSEDDNSKQDPLRGMKIRNRSLY